MKFLAYGGLRLLLFFIGFLLTLWLTDNWIYATIIGLVVSFAVGYLLFSRLRLDANRNLAQIFSPNRTETGEQEIDDAAAEDEFTGGAGAGMFHDAQTQRAEAEVEAARAEAEADAKEAAERERKRKKKD